MSRFFIHRPIFAWVLAILLMLSGGLAISHLPVAQYPDIAPPSVVVTASYPGASAKTVEDSITQIIGQSMTGIDGLTYMSATSDQTGRADITLTFANGINPDLAQIQVQNKLQQVIPLLPQIVQQQGVAATKSRTSDLMIVGVISEDGAMNASDIGDYVATDLADQIGRVPGVGAIQLFGSKSAMRIWLDAGKLNGYGLTPADVTAAIQAQNSEVSVGEFGALPAVQGQQLNATITSRGRLSTPEQFRDVVLGSSNSGAALHLRDVARVEVGQANYDLSVRYNRKPAAGMSITLAPGANALETAKGVRQVIERLQRQMPAGLKTVVPFDTTIYVRASIKAVIETLAEAVVLVFLVMYLFLQNVRATLIPTITVPIVLLGTVAVLALAGLSINMLTLFALILAIGLLVDDAIVVVENVERLMQEEGLTPRQATLRSMEQMTGALVGIATVLSAVFVPMAFMHGSVGVIYRQFSITIVTAMVLSAMVAIVITPALCATLLKPAGGRPRQRGFFRWFNDFFERMGRRYVGGVRHVLTRPFRYILVYLGLAAITGVVFLRLPSSFLPDEDQSYLFTMVKGPVGATQPRTIKALGQVERYFLETEKDAVNSIFTIAGFSFGGGSQNAGFGYVELKDWSQRKAERLGVAALQERAGEELAQIKDARVSAFAPPAMLDLGTTSGFDLYLRDDFGQGHAALTAARDQFVALAAQSKLLSGVSGSGQDDRPQFHLDIDAQRALSFGLSMKDVNDTLGIAWGGRYIDDFLDRGRVKRVIVQADAPFRMAPADLSRWFVRNNHGNMVSVGSFTNTRWEFGSARLEQYNGAPAMAINGEAAPGVSSGEAMKEVEKLAAKLPPGFSVNFTGQSYEERAAGAQAPLLYALSLIVVFLALAALYESWSIPIVILLAVPLGIAGAVLLTAARGLQCEIYFQVAVLTTIGLTAKNAILIVEFAHKDMSGGKTLMSAILRAAHHRLRPILMTSIAFGIGVLPLAIANGAGRGAQRAIGTGVFGGMMAGTFLGIFFIPLLFMVVQRLWHRTPPAIESRLPVNAVED